jgi:hypothetical protein
MDDFYSNPMECMLMSAVLCGDAHEVASLLDQDANPDVLIAGCCLVTHAIIRGDMQILQILADYDVDPMMTPCDDKCLFYAMLD